MYSVFIRRNRIRQEPEWLLRARTDERYEAWDRAQKLADAYQYHVRVTDPDGSVVSEIIPA